MGNYEVQVKRVERRLVASARGTAGCNNVPAVAFPLSGLAWDYLKEHPEIPKTGINIWIYRPGVSSEEFPVEPGAEVLAPFESDGPVQCVETPTGEVATAEHIGPFEGIGGAHTAVREWCRTSGRKLEGTSWEVYGHWNEDPSKLTSEVFYLLEPA